MNAPDTGPYALPTSKVHIETCVGGVRARHPGMIETLRTLHRDGKFLLRYAVAGDDGTEWVVLCDGSTGKIVGEQRLLDEVP